MFKRSNQLFSQYRNIQTGHYLNKLEKFLFSSFFKDFKCFKCSTVYCSNSLSYKYAINTGIATV